MSTFCHDRSSVENIFGGGKRAMKLVALIEKEGWMAGQLQRAATGLDIELIQARWSQLQGTVGHGDDMISAGPVVLSDADIVLLRTVRAGSFEQIVFRMDILHRLEAKGVIVINPARAIEIAVDKYMALAYLRDAGLPVPPTVACQSFEDAMAAFEELGRDVVVKPLFGSEGFGMIRVTDPALAERAFSQLDRMDCVTYVQQFVPHNGGDYRLFVLGEHVLGAMCRRGDDWCSNVARGGKAEPIEPDPVLAATARRAARACGTVVAGVDIIVDDHGHHHVLEVNAIPGWKKLSAVTGIDVTHEVLSYAVARAAHSYKSAIR